MKCELRLPFLVGWSLALYRHGATLRFGGAGIVGALLLEELPELTAREITVGHEVVTEWRMIAELLRQDITPLVTS